MENEKVRFNLTLKKDTVDLIKEKSKALNMRPNAFVELVMSSVLECDGDPEKALGKFLLACIRK